MSEPVLVDARGLLCPLPVIRTQNAARELSPGALVDILATDPGTLHDVPAWCRVHGHEVVATEAGGAGSPDIRIRIRLRAHGNAAR